MEQRRVLPWEGKQGDTKDIVKVRKMHLEVIKQWRGRALS